MTRSGLTVRDLMTKDVITVKLEESVAHVRRVMRKHRIHCLPVLDDHGFAVGIVTSSDLIGPQIDEERGRISQIMARHVHSLPPDADVALLARLMGARRIHHVVVMEKGRALGIVSSFDLLKLLAEDKLDLLGGRGRARPPGSRTAPPRPRPRRSQREAADPPPVALTETPPLREEDFQDEAPPPPQQREEPLDPALEAELEADADELGIVLLDAAPDRPEDRQAFDAYGFPRG